jgi:hypothetical protein
MKKALAFCSITLLLLVLIGCVDTSVTTTTTTGTTQTTTTTTIVSVDQDPVIHGADNVTIQKNAGFIPLAGITATDFEDGDITDDVRYSGNVNPNAVGVYTATYTVTDQAGNVTVVQRIVTVVLTDNQPPLLSGAGDIQIFVGEPFDPLDGVQANDTISGNVNVTVSGSVNIWVPGTYELEYSAKDAANNEATVTREVTVSFDKFVFENGQPFADAEFVVNGTNLESPAFSGGTFNVNIAPHSYLKIVLTISASDAGNVGVGVGSLQSNLSTIAVTTTPQEVVLYFLLASPLVNQKLVLAVGALDVTVDAVVTFAEISDDVMPVLNVPSDDYAYPVGFDLNQLKTLLARGVTATDNVDGNISTSVQIDFGTLSTTAVGTFDVFYSITDSSNNTASFTRSVLIANLIDSGYLTDPTFQQNGDGQWQPKSNDGVASIAYNASLSVMNITVTSLGGWASAAGAYFSGSSNDLVVGQWYMFTFTVKSSVNRQMMLRMGLQTDQANGWLDDFDGNAAGNFMNLTSEYVTYNFFFQLDSLISSNGSTEFKIELNLGNINYSGVGAGSITSFKDVYMYQLTESFLPPSFTEVDSAATPHKLTAGTALPTFEGYVIAKDMSGQALDVVIDASAVNMAVPGTYNVKFTATDEREETSEYLLPVTVVAANLADSVGPVITVLEGVPTAVDQFTNVSVDFTLLVTVADAVDGNIVVKSGMIDLGGLNFNVAGVYTVTITAWDKSGNETIHTVDITVNDKQAPTVTAGAVTINLGDAFDPLAGISVVDNVDGAINLATVVVSGLDAFLANGKAIAPGKFDIVYTVSDAAGNTAQKTIKVTVADYIWNDDAPIVLGASTETHHATVGFNEAEQATTISGIQPIVFPWDVPRLVYYFTPQQLVYGNTYKFVITVKATTATNLVFWIGSTLYTDPWLDTFDGGDKIDVAITTEYVTYEVIFTVDKETSVANGTKFQFQFGYNPGDTANTISIQEFKIVPEAEPTITELYDLLKQPAEVNDSTVVYDEVADLITVSNIAVGGAARFVNYFDWNKTLFQVGQTYRFSITVKADEAREIEFWIGSALWDAPWLDTFTGGIQRIAITNEYKTYEVYFTLEAAQFLTYSSNGCKFQFQYGFTGDAAANKIYISSFTLEQVTYPQPVVDPTELDIDHIVIDDFTYADEAAFDASGWIHRYQLNSGASTNYPNSTGLNLDSDHHAMELVMPQSANNGWYLARRYATLTTLGVNDTYQYLSFYVTNNTSATQVSIWLYWTGSQNAWASNLPASGQSGWVTIQFAVSSKTPSQLIDFAIGFSNYTASQVTGDLVIHKVVATIVSPTA